MHPELLNNSLFLRYYTQWQKNPDSVVFASIADFFLKFNLIDDALRVCKEGLKRHPNFAMGRLILAKIYMAQQNMGDAEEELLNVLDVAPQNLEAQTLLKKIKGTADEVDAVKEKEQNVEAPIQEEDVSPEWQTITMAKIYASQGHSDKAEKIFHSILQREPENIEAREGLAAINS